MPPVASTGTGFPDRTRDQEVWARCLVPGTYDEGWLQEGQVFRVGHSVADGTKLLRHAYPAVRMEHLRSRGEAERVAGPEGGQDVPSQDVEEAIREVRSRRNKRTDREELIEDVRPVPDTHGGLR